MASEEPLRGLEALVARVVEADDLPGGRAPSYRLTLDLGPRGRREATLALPNLAKEELVGRQVVCVLSGDQALVLSAHSHERGPVLLRPDGDVEDGSPVA
jgi:tRNA-binding EMAP/Myf-like protein